MTGKTEKTGKWRAYLATRCTVQHWLAGYRFRPLPTQKNRGKERWVGAFDPLDPEIAKALKPSPATAAAFDAYYQQANIQPGPVEDMARQHLSLYLTYRLRNNADWWSAPAMQLADRHPNLALDADSIKEPIWMKQTQLALLFVIAGLCQEIKRCQEQGVPKDAVLKQRYDPLVQAADRSVFSALLGSAGSLALTVGTVANGLRERMDMMQRYANDERKSLTLVAQQAHLYLKQWQGMLQKSAVADVRNTAVQLDAVHLLEAIQANPVPKAVAVMFEELVHDSMAGFIGFGMPEFQLNGYGLAKHRRIFFGNDGDDMLRKKVEHSNKEKQAALAKQRAEIDYQNEKDRVQRAKWDREAEMFRGTMPR